MIKLEKKKKHEPGASNSKFDNANEKSEWEIVVKRLSLVAVRVARRKGEEGEKEEFSREKES